MIVRLPLEPGARRIRPRLGGLASDIGKWEAILTCSAKRFRGRPVWVGPSVYLSEEVAVQGATQMLRWIERQSWMGE